MFNWIKDKFQVSKKEVKSIEKVNENINETLKDNNNNIIKENNNENLKDGIDKKIEETKNYLNYNKTSPTETKWIEDDIKKTVLNSQTKP
jgi:hypothetical protein